MSHAFWIAVVVALVNWALRLIPAYSLGNKKETPPFLTYIANVLPYAIMGMLIVYCLKGASFTGWPYALPELISIALVAGIHWWKQNTILSIVVGTIVYMVLVQFVFA